MILNVDAPADLDIKDLAPFVGYVCVYKDADEEHVGVLSRVARFGESRIADDQGLPYSLETEFYFFFKDMDEKYPISILRNTAFTLEMIR